MRKIVVAAATAAALVLGGCGGTSAVKPFPTDPKEALARAQADVKAAAAKDALWTTAQAALKEAEKAAQKGDGAEVVKYSKIASDQAELGLAQTRYPPTH